MPLGRPFTLLGSRNRAHLHLVSSTISRNHACIIATDNGLYIRDLASRSGVIVNGRRVKEADLRDGDTLQIGSFKFKFGDPAGPVRFPLTPKAAAAVLDIGGGAHTPLDSRTLLIGRRPTADIPVNNASISNTHALLFEVNGQRFIRDLGSRTGTLVNGKPVHHQLLEFGDEIKIGEISCRFLPAHGQDQPHLDEGFVEPQLDEDEPIGLDFGAHEPVVHASKNGELAPIPLEDLDELPLRLVNAAETMGEPTGATTAEPTEEPAGDEPVSHDEAAHAAAEHVAVSDDQDVTIPPTPLAAAGELGLDFLAEEAVRMPVQPLQVHAPEFLQPADHALETAEPAAPASAEAPPAVEPPPGQPAEDHHLDQHVLPDAEEQVLSERLFLRSSRKPSRRTRRHYRLGRRNSRSTRQTHSRSSLSRNRRRLRSRTCRPWPAPPSRSKSNRRSITPPRLNPRSTTPPKLNRPSNLPPSRRSLTFGNPHQLKRYTNPRRLGNRRRCSMTTSRPHLSSR